MRRSILIPGAAFIATLVVNGCSGDTEPGSAPATGAGGTADASAGAGGAAGASGQGSGGAAGAANGGAAGQPMAGAAGSAGDAGAAGQGGAAGMGGDAGLADAPEDADAITAFIYKMNGIWLVGWSGGMNHFSWVRITSSSPGSWTGTAEFLAGEGMFGNLPYWACSGMGSFMIPAKPYSIFFTFPSTCPSGLEAEYTFDPFFAPGSYPDGAILAATVTPLSGTPTLEGYKFPDTQCDAAMTACKDPLQ